MSGIEAGKPGWKELLSVTDMLVDGKFVLEEKSLNLLFRGSKNQRLINVPKSLEEGKAVLWNPEEESGVLRYKK
jgi:anaerobic ribonucleoside-triphosphate reductase activating protein